MNTLLLIIATIFAGLMAGLFYAWSISVTPGIAQVNDNQYLSAFQAMNRAILNPAFLLPFMGQVILLILLSYLSYKSSSAAQFWYILSAMLLYCFGCMAVTIFGNIPLNNSLEILQLEKMSAQQWADFRLGFEQQWNRFNWIRTISTLFSFICLILACVDTLKK
jgi:uncharacterized membrane protein